MKKIIHEVDLLIVGGGVAGTVGAIAAARRGLKTVLVQERPVLGGPSGSECSANSNGRCVNGAQEYVNRNARECGIIEELRLESFYRRANGWDQHWSLVLREWAEKEQNLTLLLNTHAFKVEMRDAGHIASVSASTLGSETEHIIRAQTYMDCSGDSFLGAEAGAEYRFGREAKSEFGESLAPDKADQKTMGSSISFRAIDLGHKVPFVAPPWAYKINGDEDLPYRMHNNPKSGYWWLEYGGECNTIEDNEAIYRKLLSVLYGVWDHVKNGGDHGADNYAITWISSVPGKRESRRLIGDHILTQRDVTEHPRFDDAVAYGGWPLDIHPPEGVFGKGHPGSTPPFIFPGVYAIPFSSLYSRNIENLMMAGRNISVTHVALGTTRLMATCALCAQAAATAAALMKKYDCSPREIDRKHIAELQRMLAEDDCCLPMLPVAVRGGECSAKASSEWLLTMVPRCASEPLIAEAKTGDDPCDTAPDDRRREQYFIASEPRLEKFSVQLEAPDFNGDVTAELLNEAGKCVASATARLCGGGVVDFAFNADLVPGERYGVRLPQIPGVSVALGNRYLPGISRKLDGCYTDNLIWCFETVPPLRLYPASNAVNGVARAGEKCANLWISGAGMPQTLEVTLNKETEVDRVELIFDTNLDKPNYCGVPSECVRDYEVQAMTGGTWRTIVSVQGNYQRRRIHRFEAVKCSLMRLVVNATNGDESARLYEFRAGRWNG